MKANAGIYPPSDYEVSYGVTASSRDFRLCYFFTVIRVLTFAGA
jgi:hypothetical protein